MFPLIRDEDLFHYKEGDLCWLQRNFEGILGLCSNIEEESDQKGYHIQGGEGF
jgi:hypothetical protein